MKTIVEYLSVLCLIGLLIVSHVSAGGYLKQNTATNVILGPFLDSIDGNTVESALTISQADVRLSKEGGDFAQKNESTSCTHDEIGYYYCPINATDTNTLGRLKIAVHESGALAVWDNYTILHANVYDVMFGSVAPSTLSAANVWETNISAYSGAGHAGTYLKAIYDKLPAGNFLSSTIWTDTKAGYLDEAISGIDDNPWDAGTRTLTALDEDDTTMDLNATTIGTVTTLTGHTPQTGDTYSLLNSTTSEPSGQGTCTAYPLSPISRIGCTFKFLRNKMTQTNAQTSLRNDADSQNDEISCVSDNGTTFTREEWKAGSGTCP